MITEFHGRMAGGAGSNPARIAYRTSRRRVSRIPLAFLPLVFAWGPGAPAEPQTRGPLVAVPHCTIASPGCGLDPATPDLNPAGCAVAIASQLERRGVRAEVIGPGTVVCGEGSRALLLEGTITAACPGRVLDESVMTQVLSVDLTLDLVLKDCFSGETLGQGHAKRAIESGRRALVRDAVEEMAHHTAEMSVRKLYPDTPLRWIRADVGGERSIEVFGGTADIESSGINDFLDDSGLDTEDYALRWGIEVAYNPWTMQKTRIAAGLELLEVERQDTGLVNLADLGRNPASHSGFDPNGPHDVDMTIRVLGIRGSVAQGLDFTLNQRISVMGTIGYYTLGHLFAPAYVRIEGLPSSSDELRNAAPMLSAELRYDWRMTPHLGLSLSGGYLYLDFGEPNRIDRAAPFPYDVDFSGATARLGISGRF